MEIIETLKMFLLLIFKTEKFTEKALKTIPLEQTCSIDGITENTGKVRQSIMESLMLIVKIFIFAYAAAKALNDMQATALTSMAMIIRYISSFIIFWSVLGRVGWPIQTFAGDTWPERINIWWPKKLYILGVFLFVISIFL